MYRSETSVPVTGLPLALAATAILLGLIFAATQLLLGGCEAPLCVEVKDFFAMWSETNLPTWFSSSCWLLAAGCCIAAARTDRALYDRVRGHWVALAGVSAFLSMDEASMFHERFGTIATTSANAAIPGLHEWQTYGLVMVAVVGLAFIPFLRRIDRGTRIRLIAAAAIFVGGALGVESIEALFFSANAPLGDAAIAQVYKAGGIAFLVEEVLEMLGIVGWIHAILYYMSDSY